MGADAMILVFWKLSFKPTFSLSSFMFIKRLFSSSSLSALRVVSSAYLRLLLFLPAILIPACASSSPAIIITNTTQGASLVAQTVKNPPVNAEDVGLISGLRRSLGEGNSLQYSCLGNPMDRGAWWATVHGLQRVKHDWGNWHFDFSDMQMIPP